MRRCPAGAAVLLALALAGAGRTGAEPLTPERVVEEIRWQDDYTVEEVRRLVYAVASMYQDELDRAVLEAVRPLRQELADLEDGGGKGGRERATGGAGAAAVGAAVGAEAARSPEAERARAERSLRIWKVIGVSAVVVGLVEAAALLSR